MAVAAILKIAISPQRFDRFLRNLVRWCKMALLIASTVKYSNFKNRRWRTAAILKTVKSPYLYNRLIDSNEIWHDNAHGAPTADRPLKFRISDNPRWQRPPSCKSQKSAIYPQHFDRFLLNLMQN